MFDRITRKTAFYAVGGGIGAAIAEIITEALSLNANEPAHFTVLMAHVAIWVGIIALGISIGLALAQNLSLKRAPSATAIGKAAAIGLISGAIAGAIAQFIFGFASDSLIAQGASVVLLFVQALCWGLAGLGVGLGVSFYTPNYPTKRAILAGFLGGTIGGGAFVALNVVGIPEAFALVVGITILGATIGLTISAAEEILREAWLTIIWGKNETSSVSLGQKPVVLGGAAEADVHLPRSKFPPVTAIVTVENGKVMLDNKLNNQKIALPNGRKINIGKITIVVNTRKSLANKKEGDNAMDARFITIVERLVREQGKDTLVDVKKCKAFLADYANNEFKKERHLLMIAVESGAGQAIASASNLAICKKQQIRLLKDDHFIDEIAAAEAVDLLALILRGDTSRSTTAQSNANSQSQSAQQQSAPNFNPPPQSWQQNQQSGYPYPHSPIRRRMAIRQINTRRNNRKRNMSVFGRAL
ncbi:MAG: hypothetical protein LBP89_00475 [Helicobacteraceae bacterium]|jgi:hypothetical protein|nr:hypothetical protein [Helicobacteraceae bacterium]